MPATEIANILQNLIDLGHFNSTTNKLLEELRQNSDSFYNKIKTNEGKDAAEKRLELWVETRHLRPFSDNLLPIIQAVQAFAESPYEDENVEISQYTAEDSEFWLNDRGQKILKITIINPEQGGCGCSQVISSGVWGNIYGSLGLKKIVICFEELLRFAKFYLVFKSRNYQNDNSSCTIEIESNGFISGYELDGRMRTMGGGIDNRMGFPGAQDYLAKHISSLGTYFTALAEKNPHKH